MICVICPHAERKLEAAVANIYIYIYIYRIIPLTKQRTNASFLLILYLLLLVHWFGNLVWGSQQVIMEHGLGDAFDPI